MLHENYVCVFVFFVCVQLDETYSVVLSSHSTPPSRLGNHKEVNITVRKNDDPFGVIEFNQSGLTVAINESKGSTMHWGTLYEIFCLSIGITLTLKMDLREPQNMLCWH